MGSPKIMDVFFNQLLLRFKEACGNETYSCYLGTMKEIFLLTMYQVYSLSDKDIKKCLDIKDPIDPPDPPKKPDYTKNKIISIAISTVIIIIIAGLLFVLAIKNIIPSQTENANIKGKEETPETETGGTELN